MWSVLRGNSIGGEMVTPLRPLCLIFSAGLCGRTSVPSMSLGLRVRWGVREVEYADILALRRAV